MDSEPINPYRSTSIDLLNSRPSYSRFVAICFVGLTAIPTCVMLYLLGQHFVALYGSPSSSYRPILGAVGFGISILNAVILGPLCVICSWICDERDHPIIEKGFGIMLLLPIILGLVGPWLIAWATGSYFGS